MNKVPTTCFLCGVLLEERPINCLAHWKGLCHPCWALNKTYNVFGLWYVECQCLDWLSVLVWDEAPFREVFIHNTL